MFRFTVTWFDDEDDLSIVKHIELDDSTLEDIAIEGISKGWLRDLLNGLRADVENDY